VSISREDLAKERTDKRGKGGRGCTGHSCWPNVGTAVKVIKVATKATPKDS